jgi:hypothetical protein
MPFTAQKEKLHLLRVGRLMLLAIVATLLVIL